MYKDGSSYIGLFKNNLYQGLEVYYWPDGRERRGVYSKDKKECTYTYYDIEGVCYEETWKD